MDNQTAGQYENNFFNVWSVSNDSENLNNNFMREFGENHRSIDTANDFTWKTVQRTQSSSLLFLDEVFEILDNCFKNQTENCNSRNFPHGLQSENQAVRYDDWELDDNSTLCESKVLSPVEQFSIFNRHPTEKISTTTDFNEHFLSATHTNENEYVTKLHPPFNGKGHLEENTISHYIETKADSTEVEVKKRPRTVFSDLQLKTLYAAFLERHYLTPETLEKLVKSLKLPENKIKTWFSNKRAALKKQKKRLCDSNFTCKKTFSSNTNCGSDNLVQRTMCTTLNQNCEDSLLNCTTFPSTFAVSHPIF